ncbi:MAG: TolC family outer membrane protein [Gammaproteobacteria bacterium]|nr:TolC family outer membrane protein [Gammaproteobacteria bacterium]
MYNQKIIFTCTLIALLVCPELHAEDLLQVYTLAETSDPVYKQAQASYRATLEAKPQARSQLLPLINLSANTGVNNQDISTDSTVGAGGEVNFGSRGYALDITQPVYHYDRYLALDQADSIIQQARAELDASQQDLLLRVTERYFEVLAAIDNLEFVRAEKNSLNRQLEQAKQRFDVGLIAITDVQEAQAGYDRSVANEIAAENNIDNTREALREITGEYLTALAPLGESMPLVSPEPDKIEAWTEVSQEQNLLIIAAKHQLETARQEIRIQNSGHYPTVDLVANHGFNSTGGRFGQTEIDSTSVGLEINVPLYEGGLVNSQTREARELYDQALERLEQQHRAAQRETREAFLGVISGISQVKALNQTVISSETALQATVAGFEVGTRTAVDVVASERVTLQAKRDYARSRYDYILDSLRLKKAAGTLSPDDLQQINGWLE